MGLDNQQKEDEYLMISGIQHFSYCRRQWALIHVEQQWTDNRFTIEGDAIHSRVHNDKTADIRNGILTLRGMWVKSKEYGLSGICDAVEFIPSEEGIKLFDYNGLWIPKPVEYKNGSSKLNDDDRLQLMAQAICLEEMFSCKIKEGAIFYHKTRRRENVAMTDELRRELKSMTTEMHSYMNRGYTPKVKETRKCGGCSLKDICLPMLNSEKETVGEYIDRYI